MAGALVRFFKVSPDSQKVVYQAEQDQVGLEELFSVPLRGGRPTKLNQPLVNGLRDNSSRFVISSDSKRVVYKSEWDLFSVSIGGGASSQLDAPLTAVGRSFEISANSAVVVYQASNGGVDGLYSVPLAGGDPTALTSHTVGTFMLLFAVSPDGSHVAYIAGPEDDTLYELYSVPTSGGTSIKLSVIQVNGGRVSSLGASLKITPDSSTVLYQGDLDTLRVSELFATPITGGIQRKVSGLAIGTGVLSSTGAYSMTGDGSRLLFLAGGGVAGNNVYSVLVAGGEPPSKLSRSITPNFVAERFILSSDSTELVVITRKHSFLGDGPQLAELFSVAIDSP